MKTQVLISEKLSYLLDVPLDHATVTQQPKHFNGIPEEAVAFVFTCVWFSALVLRSCAIPGNLFNTSPQKTQN